MKIGIAIVIFFGAFIPFCSQNTNTVSDYYQYLEFARDYRYEQKEYPKATSYYFKAIQSSTPFIIDLEEAYLFQVEMQIVRLQKKWERCYIKEECLFIIFKKIKRGYESNCSIEFGGPQVINYRQEIRSRVRELRNKDLRFNRKIHSGKVSKSERVSIIDSLAILVRQFIEEVGYPKEEDYGVFMKPDSTIDYSMLKAPFAHLYMNGYGLFADSLNTWVATGKMQKSEATILSQFLNDRIREGRLNEISIQELVREANKNKGDSIYFLKWDE